MEINLTISLRRYKKLLKNLGMERIENSQKRYGMYSIAIFGGIRDHNMIILKTGFLSLKTASDARVASGDIVVYSDSGKVVPNKSWLWDWEKGDINSYAHKMILDSIEGYKIRR